MLTKEIKHSEAYKAFIGYSTGLVPPKKTRGKGSKGKKVAVTPKKKSLISVDNNIIPEPDVSLELGKSISKTEAEIADEARRVHETHERLVTEKPKKSLDQSQKLKGIQILTEEERLATNTMQAIKASKKVSRRAGITSEVPDEAKCSSAAKVSSDKEEEKQDDQDDDDDRSIDLEETDDEDEYAEYETCDDEYVHEDEYVHDDANGEMKKSRMQLRQIEKRQKK
ncbi:hypothetical protein Tco_1491112 [Tanacetum coccineum]